MSCTFLSGLSLAIFWCVRLDMLKFYSAAEKCAVEQVAARAAHGGYGWSSLQILNPSRYIKVNFDAISPFALRTPGQASSERASVAETLFEFRKLLKNFPPFLALQEWEKLYESIPFTSWMGEAASAAKEFGLTHRFGTYCWNRFTDGQRVTDDVGVIKLTCPDTGIYADILDSRQTDPKLKKRILKFLIIRSPNRPNFFALRRFVKKIESMIMDCLGYSWAYGHPLDRDDPAYPTWDGDTQKRFRPHGSKTVNYADGGSLTHKISRLTQTRLRTGMQLFPSPERDELCVGFMSDQFKHELLDDDAEFWAQFI